MKTLTKFIAGAATAAALTVSAASPAQAQYWNDRRDNGIDTGDIIAGVAVLGGIAAIVAALDNDGQRYGYDNRYQYRDDYTGAVRCLRLRSRALWPGRPGADHRRRPPVEQPLPRPRRDQCGLRL